jgi:molybdopterin biosynthesis enzyme
MKGVLETVSGILMRSMQVAVKPAKPFAFGLFQGTQIPIFGLPGNPVSALVSYELFVRPALRHMAGHQSIYRPQISATADVKFARKPDGKLHLVRVCAWIDPHGNIRARPSGGQGSHMMLPMAEANALALVPDGEGVSAGSPVEVLILNDDELCGPRPAA